MKRDDFSCFEQSEVFRALLVWKFMSSLIMIFPCTAVRLQCILENLNGGVYWGRGSIVQLPIIVLSIKKFEWIIHSVYGVKRFHSLRSEFHSILTLVEWKCSSQRVESRPVHSIFTPKEVITDVTPQGVTSVTNRVNIHSIFREYMDVVLLTSVAFSSIYRVYRVAQQKRNGILPIICRCNNWYY